jgi:hypothetical protein
MSMDEYECAAEAELGSQLDSQLRGLGEEPAIQYLGTNGDAVEQRVRNCMEEALALRKVGFYGASVIRSVAGFEVAIRFFLARPLLQGAFLSEEWANLLTNKIWKVKTTEDRALLSAILKNWGINTKTVALSDGSEMWKRVTEEVWPLRNRYAHSGANLTEADALLAEECLQVLLAKVVDPVAVNLGFTKELTGCWAAINAQDGTPKRQFNPQSPFDSQSAQK